MIEQGKALKVTLFGAFFGIWVLAKFVSWWIVGAILLAVGFGVFLLERFYFSQKRQQDAAKRAQTMRRRQEKLEAGVGEIELTSDGSLAITIQNQTDVSVSFKPALHILYTHTRGTPKAGGAAQSGALLSSQAEVQIWRGHSAKLDLVKPQSGRVLLAREEHLYHQGLMPFIEKADNLLTLLKEQPEVFALLCTIWEGETTVSRVLRFNQNR